MSIITPTMPSGGSPRGGEELDLQNAVQALLNDYNGNVDENNLKDALCAPLGITRGSTVRRGKILPATPQNLPVDTLGSLATPDRVSGIVLPTDGLLLVSYYSRFQVTATASGNFLGVTLDVNGQVQGAPTGAMGTVEQTINNGTGPGTIAGEAYGGAASGMFFINSGGPGTTLSGAIPAAGLRVGFPFLIDAPAGTYNVEVKWRRFSATTNAGTVQDRRLRVIALGF